MTNKRRRGGLGLSAVLAFSLGFCFGFFGCGASGPPGDGDGSGVTPKESFRQVIGPLMSKWDVPGGAVALVKNEKLIMAEGYGLAEKTGSVAAKADTLFRLASLSKPITAAAALKLHESGFLPLEAKVFEILDDIPPPEGASVDPRLADVTVLDLLRHSGGWDRSASIDPMFRSREIAEAMGVPTPPDAVTIIRYMMGQPLDFTPGTRYAYSNFGYCLLGRVIEKISAAAYEAHVRENVFSPMGVLRMHSGSSLEGQRLEDEAGYYDYPGAPLALSVFASGEEYVPWPYGGFCLEAMDSHGGWVGSVVDLMRFVTAVDGRAQRPDFLSEATVDLMAARPDLPDWQASDWYYALGWQVRPTGTEANWWHTGSLPGTTAILVRAGNGLSWAAVFNSRPAGADAFIGELDRELWRAVNGITEWPTDDLFGSYPIRRGNH